MIYDKQVISMVYSSASLQLCCWLVHLVLPCLEKLLFLL